MSSVSFAGRRVRPTKIVCVGRNYAAHIEELGNAVPDEMVVFNKPPSAIGDSLRARYGEPLHYEGEIALLIMDGAVAGAGFGLDLTRRDLQSRLKAQGLPWERAKAFDGAALFSEFMPFAGDCAALALELRIDGDLRQRGEVGSMLYPPAAILAELGRFTTLENGDIVMTGTPAGVGPVRTGSRYEGRVLLAGEILAEAVWTAV